MSIKEITDASKWRLVSSSIIPDPKYAVKELIDNALDAGACSIYVDVDAKTSGCHYICVRDDGSGVDKNDRNALCLNHSTSKIRSINDLFHLESLGFRGQALFSLATLANRKGSMEITTKTRVESVGEKWLVPKDSLATDVKRRKVSCHTGTTILIRNLLLGLRARHLHTTARAARNNEEIYRLIVHYSLIYRPTRFHFSLITIDKFGSVTKKQLQEMLEPNLSRVRALSIASKLRSPTSENFLVNENLVVSGFVHLDLILPKMLPQTDVCSLKKSKRFLSVNGRVMSLHLTFGNSIARMLSRLYRDANLMEPTTWYIDIKCDTRLLDVNIEPGKDDIMIKDTSILMNQLQEALSAYLKDELGQQERKEGGTETLVGNSAGSQSRTISDDNVDALQTITREPRTDNSDCERASRRIECENSPPALKKNTLSPETRTSPPAKRPLDLISSEDERWKSNLNSDDTICTQEILNHRNSSTELSPELSSRNEDVELANNLSLSNPFMMAKLRGCNTKQRKLDLSLFGNSCKELSHSLKESAAGAAVNKVAPFDEYPSTDQQVRRKSKKARVRETDHRPKISEQRPALTPDDTTLIDEQVALNGLTNDDTILAPEKRTLYSEHTEGVVQLMVYRNEDCRKRAYKDELQWLTRDADPTTRVTESLSAKSGEFEDKNVSLSRSKEGWYLMTA